MFKELNFTSQIPAENDAYAGGGVFLPDNVPWPRSPGGEALTHLCTFPADWFSEEDGLSNSCISIFIPYAASEVAHYRRLRATGGASDAVVLVYGRGTKMRNEAENGIVDCGKISILSVNEPDDDENLASKLGGVDAWLQAPISVPGMHRRLSIYGGDLDISIPRNKGVLSDGMGYLFLNDDAFEACHVCAGKFFLQIG